MDRAARERRAYDDAGVWEASDRVHRRFLHVFRGPNTRRSEALVEELCAGPAREGRALELGCGDGSFAASLLRHEPRYVLGLDVSERFLAEAHRRAIPGLLEFDNRDVNRPIEGEFDLIVGSAILHHLDASAVLPRLYRDNLADGGRIIFREPLGHNLLMRLWWALGRHAHTPDERPFFRGDLRWLRSEFPSFRLVGVNYLSFPAGILSSLLFRDPDNALTRLADRVDVGLSRLLPSLRYRYRQALIVIDKEA